MFMYADCGAKLPKINDGTYKLDNKKDSGVGATATVICDKNFEASQKKIECQSSGKWEEATCELIGTMSIFYVQRSE